MLWTDDRRPVRMDMKLRWPSAVACICLLLSASAAQPPAAPTPARTSSTTNATNTPPASSTGRLVGSPTTRANSSTSGPGARNATATLAAPSSTAGPVLLTSQSPSKNSTLKSSATVTSLPSPSSTRRTTVAGDKSWDAAFIYDYESLRHAGLAIAGVLFIMGILVISCGSKACRVRSCRVSKGKSYQVSRD